MICQKEDMTFTVLYVDISSTTIKGKLFITGKVEKMITFSNWTWNTKIVRGFLTPFFPCKETICRGVSHARWTTCLVRSIIRPTNCPTLRVFSTNGTLDATSNSMLHRHGTMSNIIDIACLLCSFSMAKLSTNKTVTNTIFF